MLFRPEDRLFDNTQDPNVYSYDWDTLEQWIQELYHDDAILSKLRLHAMHTHIHGLDSIYSTKAMLSVWRNRSRTIWSKEQSDLYMTNFFEARGKSLDGEHLSDEDFERENPFLDEKRSIQINKQLLDDQKQVEELMKTIPVTCKKRKWTALERRTKRQCIHDVDVLKLSNIAIKLQNHNKTLKIKSKLKNL